ncbi:alpha/beta fold hydrolase [bacterium]|nr:alpha/beta fold hydrolase [bacterium]
MRISLILPLAALCVLLACSFASARAPYTLEQLYRRPYPFGTSPSPVSVSDDGRFVAMGWDETGQSIRNLWVLDRESGEKLQYTDIWNEYETRRRREFERDLKKDREAWEKQHPATAEEEDVDSTDEAEQSGNGDDDQLDQVESGETEVDDEDEDVEVFDEEERREEFEEELQKSFDSFGGIGGLEWRRDSHELFWNYGGRIYSMDMDSGEPQPLLRLKHENGWSGVQRLRGESRFLLTSAADIYSWDSLTGELVQLTDGGQNEFANTDGYSLSRDGRWLAFSRRDYRGVRQTQIPELYEENPYSIANRYARPQDTPEKVSFFMRDMSGENPWQFDVEIPDEPHYWIQGIDWSPIEGDNRLLLSIVTTDVMGLRVYLVTPHEEGDGADIELAYSEDDSGWVNGSRTGCGWRSDGSLYLMSEKDGMCAVYSLVPDPEYVPETDDDETETEAESGTETEAEVEVEAVDEGEAGTNADAEADADETVHTSHMAQPLSNMDREITGWRYLDEHDMLLLQLAAPTPANRQLLLFDLASGRDLTLAGGNSWTDIAAIDDGQSILLVSAQSPRRMSKLAEIDLLLATKRLRSGEQGILPMWTLIERDCPDFNDWVDSWNTEIIELPTKSPLEVSGEAGTVSTKLFLPPDFDPDCSYPLLVYAHGAGYAQNVRDVPQWFDMYFAWLAEERGWIVAVPDFRGSEGYGRDWRIDVKGRLGTPEVDDILVVRDHLVASYGADAQRSAIWGWSYGGFMTLMMMGMAPGEFPVGVAVAPAIDWDNYNYWYSTSRVGKLPGSEEAYERSNASEYLENITGDLLIMHGLRDNNTLFQTVAQYLEKSHEEGINVELKLFPRDSHGIQTNFNFIRVFEGVVEYCEEHWD